MNNILLVSVKLQKYMLVLCTHLADITKSGTPNMLAYRYNSCMYSRQVVNAGILIENYKSIGLIDLYSINAYQVKQIHYTCILDVI